MGGGRRGGAGWQGGLVQRGQRPMGSGKQHRSEACHTLIACQHLTYTVTRASIALIAPTHPHTDLGDRDGWRPAGHLAQV